MSLMYGGFTKIGVPYWGPYFKEILLFWGLFLGVPYFRKPHIECLIITIGAWGLL